MSLEQTFQRLQQIAERAGHRHLLWLNGDQLWCYQQLQAVKAQLLAVNSILITDSKTLESTFNPSLDNQLCPTQIVAKNTVKHLGTELDCVVFDGFSGINPDCLAQIAGALRCGGVFVLVTPSQNQWRFWQDAETKKLIAPPYRVKDVKQHFLAWLQRCINDYSTVNNVNHIFSQDDREPRCDVSKTAMLTSKSKTFKDYFCKAQHRQNAVVEQCAIFLARHQSAALIISAARGRGKSVALALLAKKLTHRKIYLTAAEPLAVEQVQKYAQRPLLFSRCIDLLALEDDQVKGALLLVDEAAGISVDMLIRLTKKFAQVVFATTTQGYEGTGQGFALKFQQYLQRSQNPHQFFQLDEPMRWAPNDPLENWLNSLLFLNMTAPQGSKARCVSDHRKEQMKAMSIVKVNSAQLLAQPNLLQQVYTLLSQAHYRTTAGDLRLILDSPNLHLWLACEGYDTQLKMITGSVQVRAVCLLALEGAVNDFAEDDQGLSGPALAQAMYQGLRRPNGNLIPQILIGQEGFLQAKNFKIARVVRIATDGEYRRAKIASKLLASIEAWSVKKECHYLASSFSIQQDVIAFWKKLNFRIVRIGTQLDSISASYSAVVMKALVKDDFIDLAEQNFVVKFCYQRRRLNPNFNLDDIILTKADTLSHSQLLHTNPAYHQWCLCQLNAFGHYHRPLESVDYILNTILKQVLAKSQEPFLNADEMQLVDDYLYQHKPMPDVLKNLNLSGYRSMVKMFRSITKKLLIHTATAKTQGYK